MNRTSGSKEVETLKLIFLNIKSKREPNIFEIIVLTFWVGTSILLISTYEIYSYCTYLVFKKNSKYSVKNFTLILKYVLYHLQKLNLITFELYLNKLKFYF